MFVAGEHLIFYHFHGVKHRGSGDYYVGGEPESFGHYYAPLYPGYIALLQAIEQELEPVLAKAERREIRYPKPQ